MLSDKFDRLTFNTKTSVISIYPMQTWDKTGSESAAAPF